MRLLWLASELGKAGLDVREVAGWESRGRTVGFDPRVVVDHHTASRPPAAAPSLLTVIRGRPDLPGPLCNILVGRDSSVWVIAAGISNNAGEGGWPLHGASHNRHSVGVEVEHAGRLDVERIHLEQLWTLAQVDAVICRHFGWKPDRCIAHKEWAPRRKIDPVWSQDDHRARVAQLLKPPAVLAKGGPVPIEAAIAVVRQVYLDVRGFVPVKEDAESIVYWTSRVHLEGFAGWAALIRGFAAEGAK